MGEDPADLLGPLQEAGTASPLFDSVVALGTREDPAERIGRIDSASAVRLGIGGATVLAVRPDGSVGLRAESEHLAALLGYRALVERGAP